MSDLIDRQAAIDELEKIPVREFKKTDGLLDALVSIGQVYMALKQLPSAEPEPCEDAVSRKAVEDAIISKPAYHNSEGSWYHGSDIRMAISALQSVTLKRKTGKWVNNIHDLPVCDQCGYMTPYDRAIDDYEYGNYCPNCGARMNGGERG